MLPLCYHRRSFQARRGDAHRCSNRTRRQGFHEWIGEMAEPSGFAQSVLEALDEFRALMPDFPIWGLAIRIDKYGDGRLP